LGEWRGQDQPPFDAATTQILGADDYLNRVYTHSAHGGVGLYVGYYGSQQQGDAIHSPQNCLPGNGWQPVSHSRTSLDAVTGRFSVNRYVVQKRGERLLVFYWFQGRGRVVANEYLNKGYLLHDALRLGRTDSALVRLITPVTDRLASADAVGEVFARVLLPQLVRWLP
jgi:EpsI family protein